MSVSSRTSNTLSLGDRFSEWAVIAILVIALLAGWFFKSSVENLSVPVEVSGISAQTPKGWLNVNTQGNEILHVTDPASSGFGTTYVVENIPIEPNSLIGQTVSLLTLERGQALTAYRLLDQKQVTVFGRPAYELSYVFVESNPNMTHNELPNIVRGMDYIFLNGDHAVVATYWADEQAFEVDLGRFQLFLKSLKF
jgi:hypothetical protein